MANPLSNTPYSVCIAQFAKLPKLGQVKTRLQPHLCEATSLSLHKQLTRHTLKTFASIDQWTTQLWVSEQPNHDFFRHCSKDFPVIIKTQSGEGLGERMGNCIREQLEDFDLVIVIGSDCPVLTTSHIIEVINTFSHDNRATIIPAEDGGYVLLALTHYDRSLFSDIEWGSDKVLEQTTDALTLLDGAFTLLAPLWDVDRIDDVLKLYRTQEGRVLINDVSLTSDEHRFFAGASD